jgi:hypothetical protein
VDTHLECIKCDLEARKHTTDVKRAQRRAEGAEQDATAAIGFAVFAVEQAEYAVLDAIVARDEADTAARA